MRTTLREKAVLWVNGLTLAGAGEYLLRSEISPLSLAGAALLIVLLVALALFTTLVLQRDRR